MDDDALIAAVAGGDDTALRELFSRHAPWLAARLRAVLPAAEVEDVLQETFLAVWRGARGYRPDGIRRRLDVGHRPAAGRAVAAPPRAGRAAAARREWPPDGRHPGDPADAALARAELADAVRALGPDGPQRETWRLMYVEDRPVAEVAELMGVPEGTVKSRARRVQAADARGAAAPRAGAGRRWTMTGSHEMTDDPGNLAGRSAAPPDVDLDRVWLGVAAEVWRRRPGRRNGRPGGCCARRAWPGRC